MKRLPSLKLLVGLAAFSWAGLSFAGVGPADFPTLKRAKFEARDLQKGTLEVTKKDVDVRLKGRVRNDWLGYDKIYTLRASNDDQLSAFRSKACIDVLATYGKQTFGRSAADAKLRLSNYGYWKGEGYYTPFSDGISNLSSVRPMNLLTYVEELWAELHFGTFFKAYDNWFSYEKHPVSFKIGMFPYQLGRGVSFGDMPMHIPYLGWDSYGYDDTRVNHPGILIHGYINKDISYDLYYTKQSERSLSRSLTWSSIHSDKTDGRRKWRGIAKDRDLWAARMQMRHEKRWGDLYVEPYVLYVDAPELGVEAIGDSCARLGTAGMMLKYKKGAFKMNVEVAGQFGHQQMFARDRNTLTESCADDGAKYCQHSHIFYGSAVSEDNAFDNGTLKGQTNSFANKGGTDAETKQMVPAVTKNGDQLVLELGPAPTPLNTNVPQPDGSLETSSVVHNSDVFGNRRFRPAYRVNYRGFMGLLDMKYKFEDVPVAVMAAGAYISGDKYPYNCEQDHRYKGFLPYGDYNYVGEYVISHIVFDARKLPRPVNISYRDGYAHNNIKDVSNLAMIGLGVKWKPFKKDKKKLMLRSNLLWFWEATDLPTWDRNRELPVALRGVGSKSWKTSSRDNDYRWIKGDYCVGWEDCCKDASRHLGTEWNMEAQYRPVRNCIFLLQFACFIPGNLYKHTEGMPNERTYRGPKAAEGIFGLGHAPVFRLATSLDYRF